MTSARIPAANAARIAASTSQQSSSPRTAIFNDRGTAVAVYQGKLWKIMQGTQAGACWMGPQYPNGTADPACSTVIDCGHGCLFCLTADPTEHHDLAASHPAALQFMQATLHKMQHGFFDPTRDGGNKSVPVQAAIDYGGFWGPFLE